MTLPRTLGFASIGILFYSLATNVYRVGVGGFSMPLVVLPILVFGILGLPRLKINRKLLLVIFSLAIYLIILIISSFLSDPAISFPFALKILVCSGILVISYAFSRVSSDAELMKMLVYIAVASGFIALAHSLFYRFVLNAPYLSVALDDVISEAGKNQLANYLGGLTVLSFFLVLQPIKSKILQICVRASFLFHFAALLYTFSRSALIGTIFVIALFSWLNYRAVIRRKLSFGLIVSVLILILGILYVGISDELIDQFSDNVFSILTFQDSGDSTSIAVRAQLINIALDFFSRNPLLGEGPGMFVETTGIATHNSYVQLLAESGVLGLIAFVVFIIFSIGRQSKNDVVATVRPVIAYFAFSLFFQNALDSVFLYFFVGIVCAKSTMTSARARFNSASISKNLRND